MVKGNSSIGWNLTSGYTMVELMIVIAIMATLSILAFFGNRSFNQGQSVKNGQLKLLSDLRSAQTQVNAGANGANAQMVTITSGSSSYTIDGVTKSLPTNVVFTASQSFCFINPNYSTAVSSTPLPSGCGSDANPRIITLRYGSNGYTRTVYVDGSGLTLKRMYAQ